MVDDSLPFQLNICLASFVNLIGALILTSFALPYLIPVILILFVLYYAVQVFHLSCDTRKMKYFFLALLSFYNMRSQADYFANIVTIV